MASGLNLNVFFYNFSSKHPIENVLVMNTCKHVQCSIKVNSVWSRWQYGKESLLACFMARCLDVLSWRHQMETFSSLLALCVENSPVTGELPSQRSVTRSVDVFFDMCPNKLLSKELWGWWFETPSRSLCPQCYGWQTNQLRDDKRIIVTLIDTKI